MKRAIAIVGAAAALILLSTGAADAGAGAGWVQEPVPLPANWGHGIVLSGVSCPAPDSCVAVGQYSYPHSAGTSHALAEYWNGSAWAIQHLARPAAAWYSALNGVSCLSAADCTAVGFDYDNVLAEHWNGSTWAVQPTSVPASDGAVPNAVACATATACIAVGWYYKAPTEVPFAESWNGTTWAVQPIPVPPGSQATYLYGISCLSATSCTAVGQGYNSASNPYPVAEHWDGRSWTPQPVPSPAGPVSSSLKAISCVSAANCTAVGTDSSGTLAEHWDGTAWSVQPAPTLPGTGATLNAVSCVSAVSCTAAGHYSWGALAETWNGTAWKQQPTARPAARITLYGVSCTLARTCTAVGFVRLRRHQDLNPLIAEQE
jgi:hypothetical protein